MHIPHSLIETSPVVDDPAQIMAVLVSAWRSHAPVAGRFLDGVDFTGGIIADVNDLGFILDIGSKDVTVARCLLSKTVVDLSVTVGRDRFAFRPVHRRLLKSYGRPATLFALPQAISHIERRLHRRLELTSDSDAEVVFPIPTPFDEPSSAYILRDISKSGLGLILPPVGPIPLIGEVYAGVGVVSGSRSVSDLSVKLMNVSPAMIAGMRCTLAGCAVLNPPPEYEALVTDLLALSSS